MSARQKSERHERKRRKKDARPKSKDSDSGGAMLDLEKGDAKDRAAARRVLSDRGDAGGCCAPENDCCIMIGIVVILFGILGGILAVAYIHSGHEHTRDVEVAELGRLPHS